MTDYGYVFSKALHEKLKEKIYAGIFVRSTNDDSLEIIIARTGENLVFEMEIQDFANKILHGYSAEYAVYEIMAKYKKFIFNRYFVKESGAQ